MKISKASFIQSIGVLSGKALLFEIFRIKYVPVSEFGRKNEHFFAAGNSALLS